MVDIHYFLFIINGDNAIFAVGVFLVSYIALRLVYRMWKQNIRCPHCGELLASRSAVHVPEKPLPAALWT